MILTTYLAAIVGVPPGQGAWFQEVSKFQESGTTFRDNLTKAEIPNAEFLTLSFSRPISMVIPT